MYIGPELGLFALIGLLFCPFAGAMAFLITYEEYSRHQIERRKLLIMSIQAAVAAALVIFLLLLVAGFWLTNGGR